MSIPNDLAYDDQMLDIAEEEWQEGTSKKWREYTQLRRRKKRMLIEEEWAKRDRDRKSMKKYWSYKNKINNFSGARRRQLPAPPNPKNCYMKHTRQIEQENAEEEAIKENYRQVQNQMSFDYV